MEQLAINSADNKSSDDAPQATPRGSYKYRSLYSVTVRVQNAKNLMVMDLGGKSDPYVEVNIDGRTKRTATVEKNLNPVWDEQFSFVFDHEPKNMAFSVWDKDTIGKDDSLGHATVKLAGLFDGTEAGGKGLLDTQVKLDNAEMGTLKFWVLCSRIRQVAGRTGDDRTQQLRPDDLHSVLKVKVKSARGLKSHDIGATNDAYVVVEFGSNAYQTNIVSNTNNPVWNLEVPVWVKNDAVEHVLKLSVFDFDSFSSSDFIGAAYIRVDHFKEMDTDYKMVLPLTKDDPQTDAQLSALMGKIASSHSAAQQEQSEPGEDLGTLEICVSRRPWLSIRDKFLSDLIRHYDSDKSGSLELGEVLHMMGALCPEISQEVVEREFALADVNKNGSLSTDEVFALLTSQPIKAESKTDLMHAAFVAVDYGDDAVHRLTMRGFYDSHGSKHEMDNAGTQLLLQDRQSGLVVRENIPAYVSAALKVLYRTGAGRLATSTGRVKTTMKTLTEMQGSKMNDASSAKNIPGFIITHQLNVGEFEHPVEHYKTFNEFFYRKLRHGARVCDAPHDDRVAVSPADCRMMVFRSIDDAKRIWIKGEHFSLSSLVGQWDKDGKKIAQFAGGSLVIARLAPQDYHRWHLPVTGVLQERELIVGDYNTVNPMAVRRNVDVYTENKRCVCPIETKEFGTVLLIAVAATMVGSINFVEDEARKAGKVIDPNSVRKKFKEHGYFAFGGSTCLVIFQPGAIILDADLLSNSDKAVETIVKVGNRIGESTKQ